MTIQSNFANLSPSLSLDFANVKALSPLVTFTRASTATYYGTQTAKAEENLFLYSQQFDQGDWQKQEVTVTANAETAPDGTLTAETITDNAANQVHIVAQTRTLNGTAATISVFAKAGTANFVYIRASNGASGINAFFNLSTGALGTVDAGITATITSFGNGWYRCVGTWATTSSAAGLVSIGIATADNTRTYVGSGSTIYAWGAQLEQRSSVTAYTPTTTQPITNYIPVLQTALAGVPRFDHNPTTFESLGLLVEEQRSNLVTYSEDFANAAWGKLNSTITGNTIVAPDGTLTGDKLVEAVDTNQPHYVFQGTAVTTSNAYTASYYVKSAGRTNAAIRFFATNSAFAGGFAYFDLANGVVGNKDASITASTISPAGNGWYRITATSTSTATATGNVGVYSIQTLNTTNNNGDGYSGIYIWGAQLE